jgi:hypothetical protein
MSRHFGKWLLVVVAAWWASLLLLGAWIVPALFSNLPTKAMAGQMAAQLFSNQSWLALGCGFLLLLHKRFMAAGVFKHWLDQAQLLILASMLTAMLLEFVAAPRIVARENIALWHGLGSGLMLLQWLLVSAVLWRLPLSQDAA